MKPVNFSYKCPDNIEEVLSILSCEKENGQVLAGGQSLIAMLNMRLLYPKVILDIKNIESLSYITHTEKGLQIGANVTQQKLLEYENLNEISPLLHKILPWVGHYQTRTRGTICGSLAHADPSSEIALCLALLKGKVKLISKNQERLLSAEEFQKGLLTTACHSDEIIEYALFPKLEESVGVAFNEFAFRHGDFSLLSVAVLVSKDSISLGVTGLSDKPYITAFPLLSGDQIDDALNDLAWKLHGEDDHIAPSSYRRNLLRKIGKKTIKEAMK